MTQNVNERKVAVAACTGLDQPLGTVARMAGYNVLDHLRPDKTVLLCPPALIAGVEEDIVFARDNPVLIIDGCEKACCEKMIRERGGKIAGVVNVKDVQNRHGNLKAESRRILGPEGEKLVDLVARLAAKEVDRILEEEG
jgi:glycine cleavage system H protein